MDQQDKSAPKWTPGPWEFAGNDSLPILHVYAPDNRNVFHGNRPLEEQEANARLCAAAPELYEALQAAVDYGCMTGDEWVMEMAMAALAKATGGQQ